MITYCLLSTKGGAGKTTTGANLGGILCDLGQRVLLLDTDPSGGLSRFYQIQERAPFGLQAALRSLAPLEECISRVRLRPAQRNGSRVPNANPRGRLDIIISDVQDGSLQIWLAQQNHRERALRKVVRHPVVTENYDVVIIDTQGAVGALQDAAIFAADQVIAPVRPDAMHVTEFVQGTLELFNRLEPHDDSVGLVVPPTNAVIYYTEHTTDSRQFSLLIRHDFVKLRGKVNVLKTTVPKAAAYVRGSTEQMPVHWLDVRASDTMHRLVWELMPSLDGRDTSNVVDESAEGVS